MKKEGFNTLDTLLNDICAGNVVRSGRLLQIIRDKCCDEVVAIDSWKEQDKYLVTMQIRAFDFLSTEHGKGNLFATAALGYLHLYQLGMKGNKLNFSKGMEFLQKAEKGNNPLGLFYLGWFYKQGLKDKGFEIKVDDSKAIEYLERAAKLGDARALFELGLMHKEGRGYQRNVVNANKCFQQAALLGHPNALYTLTHEMNQLRYDPFSSYFPKNLNFTWNISYSEKGEGFNTKYSAVTLNLQYTGDVDIGTFTFNKPIRINFCYENWLVECTANKRFGLNPPSKDAIMVTARGVKSEWGLKKLWGYMVAKEVGDLISEADCLIMDRINTVKQAQAMRSSPAPGMTPFPTASNNYSGVMFQPAPSASAVAPSGSLPLPPPQSVQQVDPARMMTIMQALQNNPMFAQQCSIMLQQFENVTAAQSQFNPK